MSTIRPVNKLFVAEPQREGRSAHVRRSIGSGSCRQFDPFLLLDEFSVRKPAGFPNHPHRGQQTVTYMLNGAFEHKDNKGHHGIISVGDVQWMTAGRGIVHSEIPATDGDNTGLQLWVNLAAKDKMMKPDYQEIPSSKLPHAKNADGNIDVVVVAGNCYGVSSPIFTQTPSCYFDVRCESDALFEQSIPIEYNTFVYVLEGDAFVGSEGKYAKRGACALLGDGHLVHVKAGKSGARFVVIGGRPHNEPIVQHGPFVMNTEKEILKAISDFQQGKF